MKTNKETLESYILSLTPEQINKVIAYMPLLKRIISENDNNQYGGSKNGR